MGLPVRGDVGSGSGRDECAAVNQNHGGALGLNQDDLARAVLSLGGEPELVIVDARTLRLLMGDLAPLIILREFTQEQLGLTVGIEQPFAWDQPLPCPDCGEEPVICSCL